MSHWAGTARYSLVRELGAGGMGRVYEAVDLAKNGRRVALKTLHRRDAESLMRLKREFRSLADVRHPNLVPLFELAAEGDDVFFTMELIEGRSLLEHLRPHPAASLSEFPTGSLEATVRREATPPLRALDEERVRSTFGQLAQGVAALHDSGHLHRDLKPSNVLVTQTGRVVILDFGLVAEMAGGDRSLSELDGQAIVGTAAYMAPEQSGAALLTPAADWYAFGVMLFQALTGRLPFDGAPLQVMLEKQRRPAPSAFELAPQVPAPFAALCGALLRRVPEERPTAAEVLETLGCDAPPKRLVPPTVDADLVGREREERELMALFERVGSSRSFTRVEVTGESGIGKSTLVRRVMRQFEASGAVVLAGRCSERESVPFKALDGVVDALARYLAGLPGERADALLPHEARALGSMFPVLRRVSVFETAPNRGAADPVEQRRRAVAALRELLGRMADRAPVVLFVDDAQWSDEDSAEVLAEVFRQPDAPALLFVVASRETAHPLTRLPGATEYVRLEPLPMSLCVRWAQRRATPGRAEAIARESQGNPFLLLQLSEFAVNSPASLSEMMAARLAKLSQAERALLDVLAVAGAPVPSEVAVRVAGLRPDELDAVESLKLAHLVRSSNDVRLEMWHDRLRDAALGLLAEERTEALHASWAEALERLPAGEPSELELTAWHWSMAKDEAKATTATLAAAHRAQAQLAFDRAANLFERGLQRLPPDDERRGGALIGWGDSLSLAGRGAAAAHAYQQAASVQGLAPSTEIDLRRRAAEQLLRAGHVDEGLAAIREVLSRVGMSLARTPGRALWALAFRRLHVMLRGLTFAPHPVERIRPEDLTRIDVCWSVSVGLGMVDTIRGASFQTRQLLLALDAGEPYRVARALAAEAAFVATEGIRAEGRAASLIAQSRDLARDVGDGGLRGLVDFCAGLTRFLVGDWAQAQSLSAQAERQFSQMGSPVSWEAASARLFSVWSLFYLGEFLELSRRIPALVDEAEARGDLYAVTSLTSGLSNVSLLAAGDSARARAAVAEVRRRWSAHHFHFQHYWALLSDGLIDLYEGRAADGWGRTLAAWPQLKKSQLLRIQNVRIEATWLKARLALATGRRDDALEARALLERERAGWATAFARLIWAATEPSQREVAANAAVAAFDSAGMKAFSAATRLRLNPEDASALEWFRSQGVVAPDRMAAMLVPSLHPGSGP